MPRPDESDFTFAPSDDDNIRRGELPLSPPLYYNLTNDFEGTVAHLSAAESSWLYHMMRERRSSATASRLAIILSHAKFHVAIILRMIAVFLIICIAGIQPIILIVIIPVAMMIGDATHMLRNAFGARDKTLPLFVEDLCFTPRIHDQALLDLYMTGMNGRNFAEALLLETLEKTRVFTFTSYILFWLALIVPISTLIGWQTYASMFITLIFAMLAFAFQKFFLHLLTLQRCARLIERTNERWKGGDTTSSSGQPGHAWRKRRGCAKYFIVAGILLVLGVVSLIIPLLPGLLFVLVWGFVFRNQLLRKYTDLWNASIVECEMAFTIFITSHLMKDELGATWAKWYYGSGRANASMEGVTVLHETVVDEGSEIPPVTPAP